MPRYLFRQQNLTNHQVIHRLEHHPSQAPPNAVAGAPSNTTMGTSATSNTWVQNGFTFSYDGYAASHITGPTSTNGGTTPSLSKTSVAGTAASNRPRYMPPHLRSAAPSSTANSTIGSGADTPRDQRPAWSSAWNSTPTPSAISSTISPLASVIDSVSTLDLCSVDDFSGPQRPQAAMQTGTVCTLSTTATVADYSEQNDDPSTTSSMSAQRTGQSYAGVARSATTQESSIRPQPSGPSSVGGPASEAPTRNSAGRGWAKSVRLVCIHGCLWWLTWRHIVRQVNCGVLLTCGWLFCRAASHTR